MLATEYLEAFPRQMTPGQINADNCPLPAMQNFRQYSHDNGLVVHAALRGERDQIEPLRSPIVDYERRHNFFDLHDAVMADTKGWDYRNEIVFSELNDPMRNMWLPLVTGAWPNKIDTDQTITTAMNSVALQGLITFSIRDKFVRLNGGTENLYTPQNKRSVDAMTGLLQEIDVARSYGYCTKAGAEKSWDYRYPGSYTVRK